MPHKKLSQFQTHTDRRKYLEKKLKIKLNKTAEAFTNQDCLEKVHCENLIGATSLPVGVSGPVEVKHFSFQEGKFLDIKKYYLPLATTEGALVASVSRGIKLINLSGGVEIWVKRIGTTRGPVFEVKNLTEGIKLEKCLKQNKSKLDQICSKLSSHLTLLDFEIKIVGHLVFIRFYFDTKDAMGMNMVTIASQAFAEKIEAETGVKCQTVSGNFCVDKKPSWQNFLKGRGFEVQTSVRLKAKNIRKYLKVEPVNFFQTWLDKCMIGSSISGSLGFNAHFANVVAAFFLATGQDPAQVVEGSQGITTIRLEKDQDLTISTNQPSIMLATVGGGTKLTTQREMLNLIGVEKSIDLAGVLGAGVLAGEISLLASQTEGSLGKAHQKLGR